MSPDPVADDIDNVVDLHLGQRSTCLYAVPPGQASAAAGGGGVLGDKNGMALHRRLPAVVCRSGRGKALGNELSGVLGDAVHAARLNIGPVTRLKHKAAAKTRPAQCGEKLSATAHIQSMTI